MRRDIGERLVEVLQAGGVEAVFGVPGGQTLPLYAAARRRGLRHVLMRDERAAACAADAYARVSGRVGVCDATVGPGVTNLISGLAEALASSVPVHVNATLVAFAQPVSGPVAIEVFGGVVSTRKLRVS